MTWKKAVVETCPLVRYVRMGDSHRHGRTSVAQDALKMRTHTSFGDYRIRDRSHKPRQHRLLLPTCHGCSSFPKALRTIAKGDENKQPRVTLSTLEQQGVFTSLTLTYLGMRGTSWESFLPQISLQPDICTVNLRWLSC